MNITIIVRPAAAAIHRVSRSSSLVSGDFSLTVAESIDEIRPSSVAAPVPVTMIVPLPCVTGVFMNAMFVWSPGPSSRRAIEGDRVLRRRRALAGQRRLVDLQRVGGDDAPVRRHLVARRDEYDVAAHHLLGGDLARRSVAPDAGGHLHHRLERVHRALGLALLAQPDHGIEHREEHQEHSRAPLLHEQRHDGRGDAG